MQYKKYECDTYNIYTIKTNRFKSCIISTIFRDNLKDRNVLVDLSMLTNILCQNNKNYKKHRDLVIKTEELYNASFYTSNHRVGNTYELELGTEFINPCYVKEKEYLDDIINFNFDMILNPNVENDEFDLKTFNVVKEKLIISRERLHESGPKYSIKRALQNMDNESISSYYFEKEDIEKVTPTSLYKTYKNIINKSVCDIYVIGDMDMDQVVSKIKNRFNLKMIKNHELDLFIENKKYKKIREFKEQDHFVQANLVYGFNVDTLTNYEKTVFKIFLEILSGGMNSKLYQKLRVENSLCYSLAPVYFKYDKLLFFHVSFDESNYDKVVKLINMTIKEVISGKITEEEFDRAKKSLQFSAKVAKDSINSILDNYIFHNLGEVSLLEDLEKEILDVKLEDVIKIASKITPNFVYLLGKEEK
ncbi:MAG: insulinase family protein [Firmicutes bacterium]|nr:insulinase family protein [Bacillota bacterium]